MTVLNPEGEIQQYLARLRKQCTALGGIIVSFTFRVLLASYS